MTIHKNHAPTRAGQYVLQPTGYQAFIPAPLPPNPPVQIDPLQSLLSQADRALGRLDGSIETLPNPDLFVYMYVRKEAVLSSQIEGTQSSLQDLLTAEAKILVPERPQDVDELINHVRAMNYGIERLKQIPLSVRLIRKIHAKLMRGVRGSKLTPGELRTSQNWIGPSGCTLNEAVFVPPPHREVAPQLSDLEKFYHADTNLPLLIKIGLAHAQFEAIHPFLDGNGRVGRLLITFMLCEREVLRAPVLYLSYYFKKHQQQYYDELQSVHNAGTWEQWLSFFLRGVVEVSKEATKTARDIIQLREKHRESITAGFGRVAGNGHRVLEYLYDHPIISVPEIRNLIGTTYQAANNLVGRLVTTGVLHEVTKQARNRKFIYQSYIDLFQNVAPKVEQ